jgi:hypothetical protein
MPHAFEDGSHPGRDRIIDAGWLRGVHSSPD